VPSNISDRPTSSPAAPATPARSQSIAPAAAPLPPRATLVADVVHELTSWNPREWTRALRHWHRGSISLVHLDVLMVLEDAGPVSMGHLAELLDVSVASATGIVGRMENRGLVVRRHDEADRRVVVVDRSSTGEQIFRDIDARRREGLNKLLESLTDNELAGLLAGHRALHAARIAYIAQRMADDAPSTQSGTGR
jgi:DNA-binding MarR family transcriptional regulator